MLEKQALLDTEPSPQMLNVLMLNILRLSFTNISRSLVSYCQSYIIDYNFQPILGHGSLRM